MKYLLLSVVFAATVPSVLPAQTPAAPATAAAAQPVTVEYYYRIKWGSHDEFKRLYEKNHAPILREMQKAGFITDIRTSEPFTHMAGGVRWDARVTITYPNAATALSADKAFQQKWEEAAKRLYPDRKTFDAEEARRFSLLEDHWDVIVW